MTGRSLLREWWRLPAILLNLNPKRPAPTR
jgi:hypothetical protein